MILWNELCSKTEFDSVAPKIEEGFKNGVSDTVLQRNFHKKGTIIFHVSIKTLSLKELKN